MGETTQADLTLTDCLRLLAEAEDKDGHPRFRDAEGKALLRRWCPACIYGTIHTFAGPYACSTCGGKGWLPLPEAEATIERALEAFLTCWPSSGMVLHNGIVLPRRWLCYMGNNYGDGDTPKLACYRALVAAMQREEAKK